MSSTREILVSASDIARSMDDHIARDAYRFSAVLREHAIFTLHNLLQGNPANQAVVDEVKPTGQWDESGVLRDTPGAIRK